MNPDLSVVIPAFNVEKFILETIKSVQNQTYENIEIIVVNDGSTDRTSEVLDEVSGDPRIKVISQKNTGLPGARNSGIRFSRGKYVGFLDGDDRWAKDKVEKHLNFLENNSEFDITFSWFKVIDQNGVDTGRRGKNHLYNIELENLIERNLTGVIARKTAVEKAGMFDESLRAVEDLDMWLRIAQLRKGNMYCIHEPLYEYRLHDGQMTKDWKRLRVNWEKVIEKIRKNIPERIKPIERKGRALQQRYCAKLAYESKDFAGARNCLYHAFISYPLIIFSDLKSWLTIVAVLSTYLPQKLQRFIEENAMKGQLKIFGKN